MDRDIYERKLRGFDSEQHQCEQEVRRLKEDLQQAEARQTRLRAERAEFEREWGGTVT